MNNNFHHHMSAPFAARAPWVLLLGGLLALGAPAGCIRREPVDKAQHPGTAPAAGAAAPLTNRVDIPPAVRQNLSMTFAKVESRRVSQTLRVPGRFELLATARREYRAPAGGRVELLVEPYATVSVGQALYRVESPGLRATIEERESARARVASMGPLREAHRVHEQSLASKVRIWEERLTQLDALHAAGGGVAAQFAEAKATLNATQAELADVMEKDAELMAQQTQAEASLRTIDSRLEMLARAAACPNDSPSPGTISVCAASPGVVETLAVTPGGTVEEHGLVLSVLQPGAVQFRARALQADLGRLRDGLPSRVVPATGGGPADLSDSLPGTLRLGLAADPDARTIDLIVSPAHHQWSAAHWARAGVSAHLEVTLAGGDEELAVPLAAIVRDGLTPILFRRDPANPDKAIRIDADLGLSDGRWVVIRSGVRQGDDVVVGGNYQLLLATSTSAGAKSGHFHPDGTFHEGEH